MEITTLKISTNWTMILMKKILVHTHTQKEKKKRKKAYFLFLEPQFEKNINCSKRIFFKKHLTSFYQLSILLFHFSKSKFHLCFDFKVLLKTIKKINFYSSRNDPNATVN